MIVEAVNVNTGKKVGVKEAHAGQRFVCPYCNVGMHPVHKSNTQFFRCFEGGKHTHYLCQQLDKSNRVYDPALIDARQLFANLFRPVKETLIPPPKGDDNPEEDPEADDPGMGHGEENGGGDEEKGETERGKELDGGEDDASPEPVILPCRTLSQLWKAGIDKFGPSERIGSCLRSDIFLWYKDFDWFFARHETLGERVIAVKPCWHVNRANAILFTSFSSIRKTNVSKTESKSEYKKKYFVLVFQDRKEYNQACKKLFIRNTGNSGASSTTSRYDMVLVAGDWVELNEEESAVFVKPGENNYGVQSSPFFSKNQIYAIPERKIKNNGLTTKAAE